MSFLSNQKQLCNNETFRNGFFFTVFSFINKGMNFILLILLAKFITPTEYGYWSLFGTIVMFMGYFIAMTTQGYISISYFKEGMEGVKKTFSCILATTIISLLLMNIFAFSLQSLFEGLWGFPWRYLYLAIGISFFTIYSNICLDFFRIKKQICYYGIFSCTNALFILILSIFFVKFMNMGWAGCAVAQFICVCLFGLISLFQFFKMKCVTTPDTKHWKVMLLWGIPLIPHLATNFIQQGCDRYIINFYHNVEQVGLFSFAYSLSAAIMMIGSGFNDANGVNIFEILGNKNISAQEKIILLRAQKKNIFFVYLISTIIVIALCYFFVPLFLPQYNSAMGYFFILAIYAFLHCMYFLYTNFLFFFKKTKSLMYTTFSFAIMHLMLSLLLTKYSLYFTCWTYCITQLGVVFFVRKKAIELLKRQLL